MPTPFAAASIMAAAASMTATTTASDGSAAMATAASMDGTAAIPRGRGWHVPLPPPRCVLAERPRLEFRWAEDRPLEALWADDRRLDFDDARLRRPCLTPAE